MSVVVMTRDRRDNALLTLERLRALPDEPPVIVVDTAAATAQRRPWRRFPQVLLTELGGNHGAVARTLGVRAAMTPYVAFSDDDSWWEPNALGAAADVFDRSPRLGLLAAQILVGPDRRLDPVCEAMAASPLPVERGAAGPSVLGLVACGAVVRRRAYLEVGGFSPVVFFFGEETVLAQDLMASGWQLAYVDSVVARHDPGSVAGPRPGRDRLAVRNAVFSLWMRRPARVAAQQTLRLLAERRSAAALAGLLDAGRRAPAALADAGCCRRSSRGRCVCSNDMAEADGRGRRRCCWSASTTADLAQTAP